LDRWAFFTYTRFGGHYPIYSALFGFDGYNGLSCTVCWFCSL
jgi:hypothetical protein